MTIDISVVIPTYREDQKTLRQNIGYLKEQTAYKQKRMEIIIADFHELEHPQIAKEWDWIFKEKEKNVKLVHVDRRGIAYARHQGIMAAAGKAIVNFDADGFFVPNEAVDLLTRPIFEKRAHLTCCDNVHDLRALKPGEQESIAFINGFLEMLSQMQANPLNLCTTLEAGMTFSKEAYEYVGGFSDVRQYEGFVLGSKIITAYTPAFKVYIPGVKAVLSPRRALASVKYGLLNSFSDYATQYFR